MPAPSIHAFAEKVVLITDGANPTGRAVALQLALQGSYVIVGFSSQTEKTRRAVEELKSLGTLANAVEADVSTVAGAEKLVAEVGNLFGRIDFLVHTLKSEPQSSFLETSEEIWEKTIDENLKSVFFVTKAAFELMSARPKPAIVTIVSDAENSNQNAGFTATQSAIAGLTKQLSRQLPKNFRINCVSVGESLEVTDESQLFKITKGVSPDETAKVVVFLLSSDAKSINGQVIEIGKRE